MWYLTGFPAEEKEVSQCVEDILFSVDQLALAFTDRFVSSFPQFTQVHFILWWTISTGGKCLAKRDRWLVDAF